MPKAVEHYSIHELAGYAHVKVLFTAVKTLTQRFQTASIRLDVERMPSFAPNTAARSQPMRCVRCRSLLLADILDDIAILETLVI